MKSRFNDTMQEVAKKTGYETVEEMIRDMVPKYGTYTAVAKKIGMSKETVSKYARKFGVKSSQQRPDWCAKIADYNAKHGTDYTRRVDLIWGERKKHGVKKVAKILGLSLQSVYLACEEKRRQLGMPTRLIRNRKGPSCPPPIEGYGAEPCPIPGPWVDPRKSPCKSCKYWSRDKSLPGCFRCERRIEYDKLNRGLRTYGNQPTSYSVGKP